MLGGIRKIKVEKESERKKLQGRERRERVKKQEST